MAICPKQFFELYWVYRRSHYALTLPCPTPTPTALHQLCAKLVMSCVITMTRVDLRIILQYSLKNGTQGLPECNKVEDKRMDTPKIARSMQRLVSIDSNFTR